MVLATNTDTLRRVERMGAVRSYLESHTAVPPGFASGAGTRTLAPEEPLRIIWVGRLLPIKGLRLALAALSSIPDVPWHLTVAGGGHLAPRLPGWLKELQIEERVNWVGQISWDEVKIAYQNAHIMLFSSLRESMGAQLYEALGSGLPAIALDIHGARDMLPDSATIKIDVGKPNETIRNLSEAIRDLIANPETLHEMSRAALEFAALNTWDAKVGKTYELIEESLGTGER